MEYIITVNGSTTSIDADKNPVHSTFTWGPVKVQRNNQRTLESLFDHVLYQCVPPALKTLKYHVFIYHDEPPGFTEIRSADMGLSVQQFIRNFSPSSLHRDRTHFTFVVIVAARPARGADADAHGAADGAAGAAGHDGAAA